MAEDVARGEGFHAHDSMAASRPPVPLTGADLINQMFSNGGKWHR
jgi:hypothetical protein